MVMDESGEVRCMGGDIASKVKNIDGNPIRSILRKSTAHVSNEQEDVLESADLQPRKEGISYAQTLKSESSNVKCKDPKQQNAFEVLSSLDENEIRMDEEVEMDRSEVAEFITKDIKIEVDVATRFKEVSLDEERYLKQKSKVDWLAEGDNNTAFFHNSLKYRNHRSRIDVIMDGGGTIYEGDNVQLAFVKHYENFLGVEGDITLVPTPELFHYRLDEGIATNMIMKRGCVSSIQIVQLQFLGVSNTPELLLELEENSDDTA
ncbi:hypothetical protein QVD17_06855 [Tagetes erecta]|uniref:Uncharacterized protein n=1 Tax=Tagetes erecta TaxID=13708 RepID=A0AAD8PC54_TARER|nr:hypothetical protein QVD17_06855 [Tagetes erecta]